MNRPKGDSGGIDDHLPRIAERLTQVLSEIQLTLEQKTLRLGKRELSELAELLVDFAEDLHARAGIWTAYERYNTEYFGTPLPMTERRNSGDPHEGICLDRVRHLLWKVYPQLKSGLILSPAHRDMERVADAVHAFLAGAFRTLSRESGAKRFLHSSNQWGWDVKRKLVWLGTESYMFRLLHAAYLREYNKGMTDIENTDDFLCQECTQWSGLGAIDILAGVLDISDDDRRDIRNWYERHASFYRVVSANDETIDAVNVISDRPYRIRMNMPDNPFRPGALVFGSLVPWRGEWYWSGLQRQYGDASGFEVEDLRDTMKRNNSAILCRFWPEYEKKVRTMADKVYRRVMDLHGKDLIVYPDGLSMAADWQRENKANWSSCSPEEVEDVIQRHGLKDRRPHMPIPKELLEHKDGIGVYINPDEGKEIMCGFNGILEGFQCNGEGMTIDQTHAVCGFLESGAVSPSFVRRLVTEYGDGSIRKAYLLPENAPDYRLDFLLRCYKGQFYRKRYPSVSVL